MQKCFTVDFLTKKRKVNEGEVPQYYVEHSHEPIITPEEFDKVQTELARRKQISRQYSGKSIFSSRIVCGDCGSYFGSKVWNSTSKYRRVIWQCNSKFKGEPNAKRRIWTRKPLKRGSWPPLTLSSKAKTTSLRIAD